MRPVISSGGPPARPVGYGDTYPHTVGGKLFTFVILMLGLGVVAVPTGLLASALSKTRDSEAADSSDDADRLERERQQPRKPATGEAPD